MTGFQYYSYVEPVTLEAMRLDHSPRDGMGVVQICWYATLTGESGARYNLMRSVPHPDKKSSMNFGVYRGNEVLDGTGTLAIPFKEHPAVEGFWSTCSAESVVYGNDTFTLEIDLEGYRWREANGRIDLRAERLGQGFTAYVPVQELFDYPIIWTDYMAKITGTIDGEKVEGIFHDSHMFTQPDKLFREIKFNSFFEDYWMDWLVEYDDGTLEGGFAMKGVPALGYTVACHFIDGQTRALVDAKLDITRNENGTMNHARLRQGKDFEINLDQHGSFDWPLHTYGTVTSIANRDKKIVSSWNYTENWPRNFDKLVEYQEAYANLFGRYPSLKGILESAKIVDEHLVFAKPPH